MKHTERKVIYMLNFYNYYDKIHPELMKKLKELETKLTSSSADNNDTLIIRVDFNPSDKNENMFPKGDVIFTTHFGANQTIKLSEDKALHISRDVKVILVYYDYQCKLLYKKISDASSGRALFGTIEDGIELTNNTLTRLLPS